MIIDSLENAARYTSLGMHFTEAFEYLKTTDFYTMQPGRHVIDGDNIFAMISEYTTKAAGAEKLEAHRTYTDIQYMVSGTELMGYTLHTTQHPSSPYQEEQDYMLYDETPSCFIPVHAGMFIIFFPGDLHMPCIMQGQAATVKKVVMKVHV